MKPVIDFEHVLSELSINRKDPCEVIRELISNSYDAKAQNIYYFPILERKGFIFIDDGLGLDTKNEIKGITPYSAFFSIGKSTKTPGAGIGYKCQGSKLCFACSKFVVISKTTSDTNWYYKELDNPQSNLTIDTDISPLETQNPWNILENIFRNSDNITEPILKSIKNNILNKLKQGTIIIVLEFKTPDFSKYFESPSLQGKNSKERNYLYNYIRFYSKHGDIRILKTEQDFPADKIKAFKSIHGVNSNLSLYMWIGGSLEKIPAGFPYIENGDKEKPHSPANVSRLTDGRFYSRNAKHITIGNQYYSLILVIDGYRRALDKYNSLGRQRDGRSEIKLSDQRGTIVCSQGIKICPYNELFTNNSLPELYSVLSDSNSQKHFTFFIDGPFSLVTNRNSLTDKSIEIINSNDFLTAIKQFLDECKDRDEVFKELIKRLNNEYFDIERTKQAKYLSELKDNFSKRDRFRINNKLFVAPQNGEEHWVGALYTLLGHIVEENNPFKKFWIRPLNFSARGIDSIGSVANEVNSISEPLAAKNLKAIEYKFQFNSNDIYNHPLDITDYIVAWTIDSSKTDKITDEFNLFGTVSEIPNISKSLSFKIRDIQSQDGDTYHNEIIVVCLKELIENTFNTKITPV